MGGLRSRRTCHRLLRVLRSTRSDRPSHRKKASAWKTSSSVRSDLYRVKTSIVPSPVGFLLGSCEYVGNRILKTQGEVPGRFSQVAYR